MNNLDGQVEIKLGIPEELRHQAAVVCYEGFRDQVEFLFGSPQKGIAIMESSLNLEQALMAQVQGKIMGFVGLKYIDRPFFQFERSRFVKELGFLRGSLAFLIFDNLSLYKLIPDEVYVSVLVVDTSMRGKGIGTLLLQAAFEVAQKNQIQAVVLDVANTNSNARRLYDRLGFKPVRTIGFRYLPKWISTGTTIMRRELIPF